MSRIPMLAAVPAALALRALETSPAAAGAFAKAHAGLRSMAAALPAARHIIHGDLLNRNVLVNGSAISAVIDWGNAAYGDWLYDAAWLLYRWPVSRMRLAATASSGAGDLGAGMTRP